jgi:hypothetical protein
LSIDHAGRQVQELKSFLLLFRLERSRKARLHGPDWSDFARGMNLQKLKPGRPYGEHSPKQTAAFRSTEFRA